MKSAVQILTVLSLTVATALSAEAQVRTPPVMNVSDASCVATLGNRCVLRSPHRTLEMVVRQDVGVVAVLGETARGAGFQISVQQDLLDRVEQNEITSDQAVEIQAELASFDGTAYELPSIEDLKIALGFPIEADLDHEDLRDLIRTHLQLTLGIGAVTASYLSDRMGVHSVDDLLPEPTRVIEATAAVSESDGKGESFSVGPGSRAQ